MNNNNFLTIEDNEIFGKSVDVCNELGHEYDGWQRAMADHPLDPEIKLWFPRFYKNDDWDNQLTDDGKTITERKKEGNTERVRDLLDNLDKEKKRAVFGAFKNDDGEVFYQFKGVFKLNKERTDSLNKAVYERVDTKVRKADK